MLRLLSKTVEYLPNDTHVYYERYASDVSILYEELVDSIFKFSTIDKEHCTWTTVQPVQTVYLTGLSNNGFSCAGKVSHEITIKRSQTKEQRMMQVLAE
jgi:hypothetical protein